MTTTDRFALPLLAAGQAQKEVTHNEALAVLDLLVQPIVQSVAPTAVPLTPAAGQCWIVGSGASGAWLGHDGALAGWTAGGWRFVAPREGMACWSVADDVVVRWVAGAWVIGNVTAKVLRVNGIQVVGPQQPGVAPPSSGANVDVEARSALAALIGALQRHGLIAT